MRFFKTHRQKMIDAWRQAELDLGIKIKTPFQLQLDSKNSMTVDILVENFGSNNGTIILTTENMDDFNIPEKHGYYCSALNPRGYSKYDRENFIDTLNDWGYFGDESNKPDWYTGEPWT